MNTITPSSIVLLALALSACDGDKQDPDTGFLDRDKDGFSAEEGDCMDDPGAVTTVTQLDGSQREVRADEIHPDALELCDGIDNDCNGAIDEDGAYDANEYFLDFDGDSFGTPSTPETPSVFSCALPNGYVDNQTDCDDDESLNYPGGTEACDGIDNDCDGNIDEGTASLAKGGTPYYQDADGDGYGHPPALGGDTIYACSKPDGYVLNQDDCDDTNAEVYPTAPELCNDIDDDCDGLTDDEELTDDPDDPTDYGVIDQVTWYIDNDADGYGIPDPKQVILWCDPLSGYASRNDDCDDTEETTNPGAAEICGDCVDQDCNELIDDGTNAIIWYEDADNDGFGDPSSPGPIQCSQPSGFADNNQDCDDTASNTYPGATEIWYNGIDNDCQGGSDYDADGDGYDSADYGGEDCVDLGASATRANPGLPEVCGDNIDNDCDDITDPCEATTIILGATTGERLGDSVDFIEDWDASGTQDLLLGASRYDLTTASADNSRGALYVVDVDDISEGSTDTISTLYSLQLYGHVAQDYLGYSAAELGVFDSNTSYSDIVVGAYGYDGPTGGASNAGAVYLVNGPLKGSYDINNVYDGQWYGQAKDDYAGFTVASAGDVDDDGYDDLLVSAYLHDPSSTLLNAGAVYLIMGPASTRSPQSLSGADTKYTGTASLQWFGYSLAGGGDIDADGEDEMIMGAPQYSSSSSSGGHVGGAFVFDYTGSASVAATAATATLIGDTSSSFTAYSVAFLGDVNDDGYDDIAVGAPEETPAGDASGTVYIVHGPVSGALSLATSADAIIESEDADDYFGTTVDGAGDVNDDGYDDILVGAIQDDFGAAEGGSAYVIPSPLTGTVLAAEVATKGVGRNYQDYAGGAIAGGGNIDGDDYADVIYAAPYDDSADVDNGGAYIIFGSTSL